jgi:hypothetical protein
VERCDDLLSELVNRATLAGAPGGAKAGGAAAATAALSADALVSEEPHPADRRRRLEASRETLREARQLLAAF